MITTHVSIQQNFCQQNSGKSDATVKRLLRPAATLSYSTTVKYSLHQNVNSHNAKQLAGTPHCHPPRCVRCSQRLDRPFPG
eukprot:66227-Rhodomonas_salina.1